jgi:hypothetical protein
MCYEFRNWSWKTRAKVAGNEHPVDTAKREPSKAPTPQKAPEPARALARESEKTPA